jgi:hypothetical protein
MPPRFAIAAMLLALSGSAAAAPPPPPAWIGSRGLFCAALDRALAAAREPTPFASLRIDMIGDADRSRMDMPGFDRCHVRGDEMRCSVSQAPPELTLENLTADTVRCLGVQPRDDEGFQVFDLEGAMIQIESECSDECQAGRIVNYRIGSR